MNKLQDSLQPITKGETMTTQPPRVRWWQWALTPYYVLKTIVDLVRGKNI